MPVPAASSLFNSIASRLTLTLTLTLTQHSPPYTLPHNTQVRMGFGLHAGWAIEGAVGSLQKVDATYLSPHVNMAARLETSSKQYGVPLLASQVMMLLPR